MAASSSAAHLVSSANSRFSISAAAALVKVMATMCSGGTPFSSRRRNRSVRTLVFPVPALADTQAEMSGSAASRCQRRASVEASVTRRDP